MKTPGTARLVCAVGAWIVTALAASPALAAPGEFWEVTSKMDIPGMPFAMPARTARVCIAKGAEKDPKYASDKECVVSDVKNSGNKTSWKVRCNQKGEIMTGVGEMSGNADKSEGTIHLSGTSGGSPIDMTQTYASKRIGGACDPDEQTRKVVAQVCDTSGFDTVQWISSAERFIKDTSNTCPGKKEMACDVIRKEAPHDANAFATFIAADKSSGGAVAKGCRVNVAATTKAICKTFSSSNAAALSGSCPAEAKALRENERRKACEGRSYTAKEDLSKCLAGKPGSGPAEDEAPVANPEKPNLGNPAAAVIDGAKALKGLFGL